ncbi:MAG TPA: hypothetical protein VGQ72_03110 [Pyrinomonadaceae bacterium]|jgi:hypothetical protein|nr:hypothetical protein [Pyrinomonadaceae bacterium]
MKNTSRRRFGKQLGLALGALPVFSLTAANVEGKKKRKSDGDSPINVGGGGGKRARNLTPPSSEIYFEHNDYILEGDTYDKNELLELFKVSVGRPNHWTNYPAGPNSRVEIDYLLSTVTKRIIINEGGNMGVTFPQGDFPYDVGDKKHKSDRAEITRLWVNGVERPLPTNGHFEIVAHTRFKPKTKRGRKLEPGDSPINVGGGGGKVINRKKVTPFADIDFSDGDYPGRDGVYESSILQLKYVLVNGVRLANVDKNTPVLIIYRRGVGGGSVAINQSDKMGVRFNHQHFSGSRGHHHGQNTEILQIKVGPREPEDIPAGSNGKREIEVHTEFKT